MITQKELEERALHLWRDRTGPFAPNDPARSFTVDDFRADLLRTLDRSPAEVPALLDALLERRISGSRYSGECCCLVGTLAQAQGKMYYDLYGDPAAPAEDLFMAIEEEDTPENNAVSNLVVLWVREWMAERGLEATA